MVEELDVLVNDLSGLEMLTNLQKCYIAGRGISDISESKLAQKAGRVYDRCCIPAFL